MTSRRSVIGNVFLFGPYELAKDITGRLAGDDARALAVSRLVSGIFAGYANFTPTLTQPLPYPFSQL